MKKVIVFLLLILFPFMTQALYVGDVDGNGSVGTSDYILVRKHLLKNLELTGDMLKRADVDGKNGITSADYITIRKIIIDNDLIPVCDIDKSIKTFNKVNDAIAEYLANPTEKNKAQNIYKKYNCDKENCYNPNNYKSSLQGNINVYKYDENTEKKELIKTIPSNDINYLLIPNSTYYLESVNDNCKVEIVKVVGSLRQIAMPGCGNFRDLGGWKVDGGTVRYGKIYRSSNTNVLTTMTPFNYLGISKVVDLRPDSEINHKSIVESMREAHPISYYTSNKAVKEATEAVIKSVVNNKGVLFNCNFGRDRTGTLAYIIEGILGVSLTDRETDFELTYFFSTKRNRNDSSFKSLIKAINKYSQTKYEEEKFINWYLSFSSNKEYDLKLLNNFRKIMIDGNPHQYKLSGDKVVLS